jgi:ribosome-associated toxin RatA of RatAB toxin-antitoxin module
MSLFNRNKPQVDVRSEVTPDGTRATAVAIRQVSKAALWRAITDYAGYPQFMPQTVECRVLATEDDGALRVIQGIKVGPKTVRYTIRIMLAEDEGRVTWTLVEGNFKRLEGSWHLEDLGDGRVRITYVNLVDVGYKLPGWVSKSLVGGAMPKVVESVVQRAQARG